MNDAFERYAPPEDHWYVASPALRVAVNTALAAEQPLLVTGEPGTGKTALARSVAEVLGLGPVLQWNTRSDHQARDCLYSFDGLLRFYDAQVGDPRAKDDWSRYVHLEALGEAIAGGSQRVVLVDEVDKAPRDFPNDLLDVVDHMRFRVRESGASYASEPEHRPVLILTSNSEKPLPDPFLRRCVFHHIEFPADDELRAIVKRQLSRFPGLTDGLVARALARFRELRALPDLDKLPATAELLAWLRVLLRAGKGEGALEGAWSELHVGALIKSRDDLARVLDARKRA